MVLLTLNDLLELLLYLGQEVSALQACIAVHGKRTKDQSAAISQNVLDKEA